MNSRSWNDHFASSPKDQPLSSYSGQGNSGTIERREFLKGLALAGLIASAKDSSSAQSLKQGIPYRTLGRTGERVSAIGMGGFHLAQPGLEEAESIRLIRSAIDRGINFMDNSWDYNEGQSEIRMGKALKDGYRQKVFLMTKLDGRTKQEAAKQIDESLKRLQTDHVDLIQHHEIIRFEDPNRIFAKQGAHEAVLEAKKAGKVRYIGFTGHKDPHIHLYMLQVAADHGFKFDTVQMPLNVMDAHFRSFEKLVLPKLVEQGIGVLGMKSMAAGIILKSKTVEPVDCLHYALNLPTSVVITGIDSTQILEQALKAARTFRPLSKDEVAALLAKTAQAAAKGEYELFKTSEHFDSTAQHPEWLGGQAPHVDQLAGPPS
jgi:aryl-alcohol dehydrogenase-like predicted oxidoreductase